MDLDGFFGDNEFQRIWDETQEEEGYKDPTEEELETTTSEYDLNNGIAKYSHLALILGLYFHVKHGEKTPLNILDPKDQTTLYLNDTTNHGPRV